MAAVSEVGCRRNVLFCAVRLALVVLGATASIACETTVEQSTSPRPMPAKPVDPPPTPAEAKANSMAVLLLGPKAQDTNGNGRGDLILVEVYLFAEPFPTPIFEDGRFVFELQPCAGDPMGQFIPLRTWTFQGEQLRTFRGRARIGPSHRFPLNLLDNGGDQLPCATAELTARFEPADGGPPVRAVGTRSAQLGGMGS